MEDPSGSPHRRVRSFPVHDAVSDQGRRDRDPRACAYPTSPRLLVQAARGLTPRCTPDPGCLAKVAGFRKLGRSNKSLLVRRGYRRGGGDHRAGRRWEHHRSQPAKQECGLLRRGARSRWDPRTRAAAAPARVLVRQCQNGARAAPLSCVRSDATVPKRGAPARE